MNLKRCLYGALCAGLLLLPAFAAADALIKPLPVPDTSKLSAGQVTELTTTRAQFDKLAPQGLEFPPDYLERRYPLTDDEVKIGRTHEPAKAPDINLSGAPEDPAISHMHAVLERQNDGSYKLRDLGSTNGTTMNDDPTPVSADVGAPLVDGDRIRIGAWTMLTLHRTGSS